MRSTKKARIRAAAGGLASGFALLGAGDAVAATLDGGADGVLRYTASAGQVSSVGFSQTAPTTVQVDLNPFGGAADTDPITPSGTCTAAGAGDFECTGITSVVADAGDRDDLFSGAGLTTVPATLAGGDGDDTVLGGDANDTLSGGNGRDFVDGRGGNDTVNGDAGDDNLEGGTGADAVNGGDGDDGLSNFNNTAAGAPADNGDTYTGGGGLDTINVQAGASDPVTSAFSPVPVSVTLDEQANDGSAGEGDNVRGDVESVTTFGIANDTLSGNAATNQLSGGGGNDAIDGGAGNDVLQGQDGDDTINARDGFADVVTCGAGNDTANVDTLDTVSSDCEVVNRVEVGNANEDRPPSLTVSGPAQGATVSTTSPSTFTANVTDDRGIAQVLFLANGRLVCTDTVAPYTCDYRPTGADIGRTAITVVAIDSSQQTTTVIRSINVGLFKLTSLSSKVTPRRDTTNPRRFVVTGKLGLPRAVTAAQGCRKGVVSVQVKAGSRTISTRRVNISRSCTYRLTVIFRDRSRFRGATALKFTARFLGNAVLDRRSASVKTARVR